MKLYILDTPFFHIDGGAYFGVVPKIIWEKKYPADDKNMCKAACRSILVVDGKRKILFDTGIGDKPQKDSNDLYFIDYSQNLIENLKKIGYSSNDITDVVLTHLHFDHCGGCFVYDNNQNKYSLHFKNALYHVTKAQWNNALNPNDREKSSYFPDKIKLLNTEGNLNLVEKNFFLTDKIELRIFNGHTP